MKVSIVTVCFNSAETIEGTIKSVLSQDHKDIEYIIVDGGSTDGTLEAIRKHSNRLSRVVSEPDKGIYDAMNKGLKLSSGDVTAVLNSGDLYHEDTVVSKMAGFMRRRGLDAAYGDLVYVDHKNTGRIRRFWKPGKYKKGSFSYGWVIPHPTFFCRREVFEKYGYFNEDFQIAADFDLMVRFVEKHQINVGYLNKVIVKMRTGGKANVFRGILRGNLEIMRSFRLNGLRLSPWFFVVKPISKSLQLLSRPAMLNSECADS